MNLDDLIKLAGLSKSADTPVQEQPNDGIRTLIALVTPEQLNQLQGEEAVEEEGYQNSGDHYSGEPEEYKGTLGSPADLSLRRYLGANGDHVTVDETKVYEDHKVEDITEAYAQYKAAQNQVVDEDAVKEASCGCGSDCGHCGGKHAESEIGKKCDCCGNMIKESVAEGKFEEGYHSKKKKKYEAVVDEDDVEEDNAFNSAAANAKKDGKKSFSFNGKTYPVKMDAKTADGLTDDINILKQLAGI